MVICLLNGKYLGNEYGISLISTSRFSFNYTFPIMVDGGMNKLLLILLITLSFSCYASSDEKANKLFVETVIQWQEYESKDYVDWVDLDTQYELLSKIDQNIQKIIDKYPGSNIAVQLIAFREFGILSVDKVEKRLESVKSQIRLLDQAEKLLANNQTDSVNQNNEESLKNNKESSGLTCNEPAIIKFAYNLINSRANLKGFNPKNVGTSEAYLLIGYQNLNYVEAKILFENLKSSKMPRSLKSFENAFEINQNGIHSIKDNLDWVTGTVSNPSSLKAIILMDGGITYLNLLNKYGTSLNESFIWAETLRPINVHRVISDQTDDFKLEFSKLAELTGELGTAGVILGSRKDLSEYKEFLIRNKSYDKSWIFDEQMLYGSGVFASHQDQFPYFLTSISEVDRDKIKLNQDLFDSIKAAYFVPESDFLAVTLNQSGLTNEISNVSRKYLEARELGVFSDDRLADEHWIFLYSALIDEVGKETAETITNNFNVNISRTYGGEFVPYIVASMTSLKNLTPFVLDDTKTIPNRPKIIPDDFNWEMFVNVAEIVKKNPDDISYLNTLNKEELGVAYEFLFILGEFDKLLGAIDDQDYGTKQSFMSRLDATCRNYLSSQGEALNGGRKGNIFWQFDKFSSVTKSNSKAK